MNNLQDGADVVTVIAYTSIAFVLMALVLIMFFYFSRKKIITHELDKKDLQISHQKELLHSIILTQEIERRRIAQDLHDDISSKLNIVSLNSHLLTTPGLSENEMAEITLNIINLTGKALENSRRIAHDLSPPVLEKFGLQAAIEELCMEFKTARSISISFENKLNLETLETDLQLQVFRILQELMNNSLRHGNASQISILFDEVKNERSCIYTDNGVGFDIASAENSKGLGMKNIRSRAEIFNGNIIFNSAPEHGVQVTFTF